MNFLYYDLGFLNRGASVVITIKGTTCNVKLMDSFNFNKYKNGLEHQFYGGQAIKSPIKLIIPESKNWNLAIDSGNVSVNVEVIK